MSVFTIQVVTGTSPNWSLKVDTSANILVDDQVLCLVGGSTAGGVYRVAGIPDSTHVAIVDDLGDQLYGRPGAGRASSWTPTPNLGLSQVPDSAYLWGTTSRRDGQLIDQMVAIARGTLELTDPASITPPRCWPMLCCSSLRLSFLSPEQMVRHSVRPPCLETGTTSVRKRAGNWLT